MLENTSALCANLPSPWTPHILSVENDSNSNDNDQISAMSFFQNPLYELHKYYRAGTFSSCLHNLRQVPCMVQIVYYSCNM